VKCNDGKLSGEEVTKLFPVVLMILDYSHRTGVRWTPEDFEKWGVLGIYLGECHLAENLDCDKEPVQWPGI
jgi:hypothetical protein